MGDYRIQVTIRRRGEPVFTSEELKTENHDDLLDLMAAATEFVVINIEDDMEGNYDTAD